MWLNQRILILLFVGFGMASASWADSGQGGGKGAHEKTWERVHMIKMIKLTEALKMDRDQAGRFFAVENQYEDTKRKARRELHEDIHKLRTLVRESNPSERDLRDTVNRIKNRKKDLDELTNKQTDEELNLLRPDQQARYILFTIDFRREMENLIREVREGRPPRQGGEMPQEKTR
jgi:Spy/CpxP family protein refolding chaperone